MEKKADQLAMALDDSEGDGRQFSHIYQISFLNGYNFVDGFGVGLSLGASHISSKFDGAIDDEDDRVSIEQDTTDYTVGGLLYSYGENYELSFVHHWNYAIDPIQQSYYTGLYMTIRWSYTFY